MEESGKLVSGHFFNPAAMEKHSKSKKFPSNRNNSSDVNTTFKRIKKKLFNSSKANFSEQSIRQPTASSGSLVPEEKKKRPLMGNILGTRARPRLTKTSREQAVDSIKIDEISTKKKSETIKLPTPSTAILNSEDIKHEYLTERETLITKLPSGMLHAASFDDTFSILGRESFDSSVNGLLENSKENKSEMKNQLRDILGSHKEMDISFEDTDLDDIEKEYSINDGDGDQVRKKHIEKDRPSWDVEEDSVLTELEESEGTCPEVSKTSVYPSVLESMIKKPPAKPPCGSATHEKIPPAKPPRKNGITPPQKPPRKNQPIEAIKKNPPAVPVRKTTQNTAVKLGGITEVKIEQEEALKPEREKDTEIKSEIKTPPPKPVRKARKKKNESNVEEERMKEKTSGGLMKENKKKGEESEIMKASLKPKKKKLKEYPTLSDFMPRMFGSAAETKISNNPIHEKKKKSSTAEKKLNLSLVLSTKKKSKKVIQRKPSQAEEWKEVKEKKEDGGLLQVTSFNKNSETSKRNPSAKTFPQVKSVRGRNKQIQVSSKNITQVTGKLSSIELDSASIKTKRTISVKTEAKKEEENKQEEKEESKLEENKKEEIIQEEIEESLLCSRDKRTSKEDKAEEKIEDEVKEETKEKLNDTKGETLSILMSENFKEKATLLRRQETKREEEKKEVEEMNETIEKNDEVVSLLRESLENLLYVKEKEPEIEETIVLEDKKNNPTHEEIKFDEPEGKVENIDILQSKNHKEKRTLPRKQENKSNDALNILQSSTHKNKVQKLKKCSLTTEIL